MRRRFQAARNAVAGPVPTDPLPGTAGGQDVADSGAGAGAHADNVSSSTSIAGSRPLAAGSTAEVHPLGERRVVKWFRPDADRAQVRYEHDVCRMAASSGLPVPEVLDWFESGGRPGILFQRIEGPTMLEAVVSSPRDVDCLARDFARLHAEVHSRRARRLPTARGSLATLIEGAESLPERWRQRVLESLTRLPGGEGLIHGDFHPGNVMISPCGPVIIDWSTAQRENRHADIARTLMLLLWCGARFPKAAPGSSLGRLRRRFARVYRRRYGELRPDTRWAEVGRWLLPCVAARLAYRERAGRENGTEEAVLRKRLGRLLGASRCRDAASGGGSPES